MTETISMKSTKQQIYDAYLAASKRLDEIHALKDDPVKEANEIKKKETIASADQIAQESILNPDIVKRYNDLKDAIEMKQLELEDLYGIELKANSLVAIINAHKDKVAELETEYKEKETALKESLQDTKDMLNAEIKELEDKKRDTLNSITDEAEELKETIATERSREEEEYNYNLARSRKKEEDAWEDNKKAKEKILAEREAAVLVRENEVDSKEEYIKELEEYNNHVPELIESAKQEGIEKGKADANKSNTFEVRALKQENEYQIKILQDRNERLEAEIVNKNATIESLQTKLDEAYSQMRDLATKTVESTGGVKILNGTANTQNSK